MRDRTANGFVAQNRMLLIERKINDFRARNFISIDRRILLEAGDIRGDGEAVGKVNTAGFEFDGSCAVVIDDSEVQRGVSRLVTPVRIVAGEGDVVAADPLNKLERAGADGLTAEGRLVNGLGVRLADDAGDGVCQNVQRAGVGLLHLDGDVRIVGYNRILHIKAGEQRGRRIADRASFERVRHVVRRQFLAVVENNVVADGHVERQIIHPVPLGRQIGLDLHRAVINDKKRVVDLLVGHFCNEQRVVLGVQLAGFLRHAVIQGVARPGCGLAIITRRCVGIGLLAAGQHTGQQHAEHQH